MSVTQAGVSPLAIPMLSTSSALINGLDFRLS